MGQAAQYDHPGQIGTVSAGQGEPAVPRASTGHTLVSDFTYVAAWKAFVYVAFVIDAYARRIVVWRVNTSAHVGFVLDALEQAGP